MGALLATGKEGVGRPHGKPSGNRSPAAGEI